MERRRTFPSTRSPGGVIVLRALSALVLGFALAACSSDPLTAEDVTAPPSTTAATTTAVAPATTAPVTTVTPAASDTTEAPVAAVTTVTPPDELPRAEVADGTGGFADEDAANNIGFDINLRSFDVEVVAEGATDPVWDFGDGTTERGAAVNHRYGSPGEYVITMTDGHRRVERLVDVSAEDDVLLVTADDRDEAGSSAIASVEIEPPDPTVRVVTRGRRVELSASGGASIDRATWDLGDGSVKRISAPTHLYERSGTYLVVLVAENAAGQTAVSTTVVVADGRDSVTVRGTPVQPGAETDDDAVDDENEAADESEATDTAATVGAVPLVAAFDLEIIDNFVAVTNRSIGGPFAEIAWDFGDGTTATGRTASHRYADIGQAIVTLRVRSSTTEASVDQLVLLDFDPPLQTRQIGNEVTLSFTDSARVADATWDFGDDQTADGATVTHAFEEPGTQSIRFVATGEDGRSTTRVERIEVKAPVTADFDVVVVDCATIRLVDRSSESVERRRWLFGDGETDDGISPTHTYAEAGTRTVTLETTNRAYDAAASAEVTTTCGS